MAAQQDSGTSQEQYNLVYTLGVQPGIKRDGTTFETREFSDGEWCRFQRSVPKKMGGYRQLFGSFNGIPRGMVNNAFDGINYVFVGTSEGLEVFTTGTTFGVGSGPYEAKIFEGYGQQTVTANTTSDFEVAGDLTTVFVAGTLKAIVLGDVLVTVTG
jgi:hypothetical protein